MCIDNEDKKAVKKVKVAYSEKEKSTVEQISGIFSYFFYLNNVIMTVHLGYLLY